MSRDVWVDRVRGMVEDIDRIMTFVRGIDRDAFLSDEKTMFAVCYAFVRLGEAVFHVPPEVVDAHPEIEWGKIRHFRNFMIHVYFAVDPARLYDTAHQSLPALRPKLQALMDSHG